MTGLARLLTGLVATEQKPGEITFLSGLGDKPKLQE
jgi:hypothetical protein